MPVSTVAQEAPALDREVVVAFQPGVVTRPSGVTEGPVSAFDFGAPGLAVALDQVGVEYVYQLFPGFTPEDRFVTTEWGETLELTDWSDTYVLRLRESGARPGLLGLLRALRGEVVIYAEPNPTVDFFDRTHVGPVPTAAPEMPAVVAVGGPLPCALPNGGGGGGEPYFCHQWALANTGQGMGTQGVDINAQGAWTRTTGASTVAIAVVDGGINDVHPEFLAADGVTSRVSGDPPFIGSPHGNGLNDHRLKPVGS